MSPLPRSRRPTLWRERGAETLALAPVHLAAHRWAAKAGFPGQTRPTDSRSARERDTTSPFELSIVSLSVAWGAFSRVSQRIGSGDQIDIA
jgi:hypothetical protein